MKFTYKDNDYNIIIDKKRIKNTYIRVKDDLNIYISTNIFTSKSYIDKLINDNRASIEKMIDVKLKRKEKSEKFFYLGKEYNVVKLSSIKKPTIDDNYIYVNNSKDLDKFLDKEAKTILKDRLYQVYYKINNKSIPLPTVKIRKMVRKWGYCNKLKRIVCLNKELIKYDLDDIDYVIVHELCHFLYFDHSKDFWNAVKLYKPDYKINKKHLKED